MRNLGFKFLLGVTFGAILLIFFNVMILRQARLVYAPGQEMRRSLFSAAVSFNEFLGYVRHWKGLVSENQRLKSELNENLVRASQFEAIQRDNDSLRKALNLSSRFERTVVPAGLFNINLTPDGYNALINRGKESGIETGNIVVTPEGLLVGQIEEVFANSSRLMLVSDPNFKTAVRVLNGETSGITKGALADGMILELVVQTDKISEGDVLISTGDDAMPAGLVVGTVRNVQYNETEIFQKVKITPAMRSINGSVLVLKP